MSEQRRYQHCGGIPLYTSRELPERRPYDEYLTPEPIVRLAFDFLLTREPLLRAHRAGSFAGNSVFARPWRVLDLGAGTGVWGQVAREIWPQAMLYGIDVQSFPQPAAYDVWRTMDLRDFGRKFKGEPLDLVVGNPPYKYAEAAVESAFSHLAENGLVMLLLPLNFLAGQRRRDKLYKKYPLTWHGTFSTRISWSEDGKTPPRECGLYLWRSGYQGPFQGYFLDDRKTAA